MNKFLKQLVIRVSAVGCLLFHLGVSSAQTYYVSSLTGNDRNAGTSRETALKTIDEVNRRLQEGLLPGSKLLFERGGIYYGSIRIPSSVRGIVDYPITFGPYGEGDMPVISGAKQISNWEQTGNNTWKASVSSHPENIDILFINGKKYYPARYPNRGYRTVTNRYSNGLQDNTLKFPDGYWNGATIAFKMNDWEIYRDTVNYSYSDGRIDKIGRNSSQTPGAGWGYFFQNHINALDTIGEYVYDKRAGTLTLCTNKNPKDQLIEYMDTDYGVRINYSGSNSQNGHIHIEGLCFQHYKSSAIYAIEGKNLIIRQNVIRNTRNGIYIALVDNCQILGNTISDVECNGLTLGNVKNSRIHNNTICRVAISLDGGQNGIENSYGILMSTPASATQPNDNCEITGNRIDSIGYIGIRFFFSQNLLVKNNVINYSMLSLSDGGGIYAWKSPNDDEHIDKNKPNKIIDNIVLNTIGNDDGSANKFYNVFSRFIGSQYGIYLDDDIANLVIEGNTVANSGRGIFFHGSQGNKVRNNVLFNNIVANIACADSKYNSFLNNEIKNNYIYGQNTGRFPGINIPYLIYSLSYGIDESRIASTNQVDSNYISAPFNANIGNINGSLINKNTLSTKLDFDVHSNAEPVSFAASGANSPEEFAILVYNPTPRDSAILLDHSYMSFNGMVHAGSIHLQPFTSAILFRYKNTGEPLDAPVVESHLCLAYHVPESLDLLKVDTIIWVVSPSAAGLIKSVSDNKGGRVIVEWHNYQASPVQLIYSVQMNDGSSYVSKPLTVNLEQDIERSPAPVGTSEIKDPTIPGFFTADNPAATEIEWILPSGVGILSPYDTRGNTVSVVWRQNILGTYPITYRLKNPCGEWGAESFPLYCSFSVEAPELSHNNPCAGTNTNFIARAYHGALSYQWTITPSEAGSTTSRTNTATISWSPYFSGQAIVSYTVAISTQESYSSPHTLVVVGEMPTKPTMATGADKIYLNHPVETYRATSEGIQYEWIVTPLQAAKIQNCENETASILWNTTYLGEATVAYRIMNECGWSEISYPLVVRVHKSDLFDDIPGIFTPNGDGFNDTWDIPSMHNYPDAMIRIYNRAKKLTVEFKGAQLPWNGRDFSGRLLESGYYLYQIEVQGQGIVASGYVTVLR